MKLSSASVAQSVIPIGAVLFMAYIGGIASFLGPILGAVIYTLLEGTLSNFTEAWFLYLGIIALHNAIEDPRTAARACALLAIVGVVNIPIIHYSVEWWNTLHQPASVLRGGGPSIAASMLWPLFIMAFAFKAYFVTFLLVRMRSEITAAKLRALRRTQVDSAGATGLPSGAEADRA